MAHDYHTEQQGKIIVLGTSGTNAEPCSNAESQARVTVHTRTLAESLARLFHISPGKHLVPVLGTGSEQDNITALQTWVAHHEKSLTTLEPDKQLKYLTHALQAHLDAVLDALRDL